MPYKTHQEKPPRSGDLGATEGLVENGLRPFDWRVFREV